MRKQKAELEKITSIRKEHWPSWDILEPGGGRLGTDIYKPLVIDQVIVLRRDYKGSVGAVAESLSGLRTMPLVTMATPSLHW